MFSRHRQFRIGPLALALQYSLQNVPGCQIHKLYQDLLAVDTVVPVRFKRLMGRKEIKSARRLEDGS